MVNFLTDEFFWRERVKKIIFAIVIVLLPAIAFIANNLLNLYLENKDLELKLELVNQRIELVEERTMEIDDFKADKEELKAQLSVKREEAANNLSVELLMEKLAKLNFVGLYFTEFELYDQHFDVVGITTESIYLNQLINQLEEQEFFQSYHLENIAENNEFIKFNIRGEVRKGLEND